MKTKGIDYLRQKLNQKRYRVNLRYEQYAMKRYDYNVGATIPAQLRGRYKSVLGWCAKGVDALADRLVFREFENDNFNLEKIFNANNRDVFFDSAILSSLIASCSFVYISKVDNEELPRLQVIEASNATGIINPINGLLTEGYAVLDRDDSSEPTLEAYFTSDHTYYIYKNNKKKNFSIPNPTGHPLLVPIIYRPDAVRPFGRSRITRSGMYFQRYAKRTLERSDITAEFYSFPQKYVVGMSMDAEPMDTWKATVSSMLQFTKDEDGEAPKLGQFKPSSMSPFIEQLRTAGAGFAGEMDLTLNDLGFVSDNPSSVEAIKASHENLRLAGRKAQRSFNSGLINVAYLACGLRDGVNYSRSLFAELVPKWEPLFEADASMLSLIGDGAIKLNQALPGFVNKATIRDLTGVDGNDPVTPIVNYKNVDVPPKMNTDINSEIKVL